MSRTTRCLFALGFSVSLAAACGDDDTIGPPLGGGGTGGTAGSAGRGGSAGTAGDAGAAGAAGSAGSGGSGATGGSGGSGGTATIRRWAGETKPTPSRRVCGCLR